MPMKDSIPSLGFKPWLSYLTRYFCGFEDVPSIVFLASRSSFTVSAYQRMFPSNFPFKH
jgi:hypothetical protein